MRWNKKEILKKLAQKHNLEPEDLEKIQDQVGSICDTVNEDFSIGFMRPYSHNVISMSLGSIDKKLGLEIANDVIVAIPVITDSYKIHPEGDNDLESC